MTLNFAQDGFYKSNNVSYVFVNEYNLSIVSHNKLKTHTSIKLFYYYVKQMRVSKTVFSSEVLKNNLS